jgi:hypothetical protein
MQRPAPRMACQDLVAPMSSVTSTLLRTGNRQCRVRRPRSWRSGRSHPFRFPATIRLLNRPRQLKYKARPNATANTSARPNTPVRIGGGNQVVNFATSGPRTVRTTIASVRILHVFNFSSPFV